MKFSLVHAKRERDDNKSRGNDRMVSCFDVRMERWGGVMSVHDHIHLLSMWCANADFSAQQVAQCIDFN